MRNFTPEEVEKIELGGYALLPTHFIEGTINYTIAVEIVKCLNNEKIIDESILDETIFICFSNGAKVPPMTAVIPRESFGYVENFIKIKKELSDYVSNDALLIYKSFSVLYLNNIIRIYPEEQFAYNLALDRMMHYSLPSVVETIWFVDTLVDLIETNKPAFVSFINYQETAIERILTNKIKYISDKEQTIAAELQQTKEEIKQMTQDSKASLEENNHLVQKNSDAIKENRNSIITIVSLIVTIVPLFIVNFSVLINSFNIIMLLCINGIMLSIVSVIYYLMGIIVGEIESKKKPFKVFAYIGIGLLIIGIVLWFLAAYLPQLARFLNMMSI